MDKVSQNINYKETLRVPPHDTEAEQSVLGALMIDKNAIIKVVDVLLPADFYKGAHQRIFETMMSLFEKRQPIDIVSVSSKLKERKQLDEIGGHAFLASLVNTVPTASHVNHYANTVKEKHILRELISASAEIHESAFSAASERGLETVLDDVEQRIFQITQRSIAQQFSSIQDELGSAFERIDKIHKGEHTVSGLPTGFTKLDNYLSGLQKSDLIIIGARPSLGKTSFALDIARHVAVKKKEPVGFFSLEMSREQIVDRLIAAEADVNLWKMRTGKLDVGGEDDFMRIQNSLDRLSQAPIFIDDTPSPNILQMRAMARRLQMERGLSLVVVDYLQLISPRNPRENMVQQVTEVSRGLKGLARELKVPIIALSQLSRAVDQREDKTPKLHDLRESGSLEQDSDIVLFIHRKDRHKMDVSPEEKNIADIIISKHRNGATGTIKLKFDQDRVSFRNLDTVYSEGDYL